MPRLKGGPAWPENELAACRPCNRARGHTARRPTGSPTARPAAWNPNRALVLARLEELRDAIAARGGQRRARPYLDAQLRRLAR